VTATGIHDADIAIAEDKIRGLEPGLTGQARTTFDASGLHIFRD